MTGAMAMVKCLEQQGSPWPSAIPELPFAPSMTFWPGSSIHHVLVRTEQNAAHSASGYARISGQVGVCIATSGPAPPIC